MYTGRRHPRAYCCDIHPRSGVQTNMPPLMSINSCKWPRGRVRPKKDVRAVEHTSPRSLQPQPAAAGTRERRDEALRVPKYKICPVPGLVSQQKPQTRSVGHLVSGQRLWHRSNKRPKVSRARLISQQPTHKKNKQETLGRATDVSHAPSCTTPARP